MSWPNEKRITSFLFWGEKQNGNGNGQEEGGVSFFPRHFSEISTKFLAHQLFEPLWRTEPAQSSQVHDKSAVDRDSLFFLTRGAFCTPAAATDDGTIETAAGCACGSTCATAPSAAAGVPPPCGILLYFFLGRPQRSL
jgi:hypothetical protein